MARLLLGEKSDYHFRQSCWSIISLIFISSSKLWFCLEVWVELEIIWKLEYNFFLLKMNSEWPCWLLFYRLDGMPRGQKLLFCGNCWSSFCILFLSSSQISTKSLDTFFRGLSSRSSHYGVDEKRPKSLWAKFTTLILLDCAMSSFSGVICLFCLVVYIVYLLHTLLLH